MNELRKYKIPEKPELPFRVPELYFENSEITIIQTVESLKKTPFNVSESYFNELSTRIGKRIPALPSELPFETPDGYFDTLSHKIQTRKAPTPTGIEWKWGYAAAMAAAIALVVVLWSPLSKTDPEFVSTKSSTELIAAIDKQTIHQYLETSDNHEALVLEIAEEKNIALPQFGDTKASEKESELWKKELELEDLEDLDELDLEL